jgi:hypothetical protein
VRRIRDTGVTVLMVEHVMEIVLPLVEVRRFSASLLETEGNPLVFGERTVDGARRTILYYVHYDGQPVNPELWKQESPWKPILRDGRMEDGAKEVEGLASLDRFEPDWRIYARSASDDTSPIIALMAAIDALDAAAMLVPLFGAVLTDYFLLRKCRLNLEALDRVGGESGTHAAITAPRSSPGRRGSCRTNRSSS